MLYISFFIYPHKFLYDQFILEKILMRLKKMTCTCKKNITTFDSTIKSYNVYQISLNEDDTDE